VRAAAVSWQLRGPEPVRPGRPGEGKRRGEGSSLVSCVSIACVVKVARDLEVRVQTLDPSRISLNTEDGPAASLQDPYTEQQTEAP
jgi:hypothetical protein